MVEQRRKRFLRWPSFRRLDVQKASGRNYQSARLRRGKVLQIAGHQVIRTCRMRAFQKNIVVRVGARLDRLRWPHQKPFSRTVCSVAAITSSSRAKRGRRITNGDFYGATGAGGAGVGGTPGHACGTVFRMTPSGTVTTLRSFCANAGCTDGALPTGVVEGPDGAFYGTTNFGGSSDFCDAGCGTIFKITKSGRFTMLYSF